MAVNCWENGVPQGDGIVCKNFQKTLDIWKNICYYKYNKVNNTKLI